MQGRNPLYWRWSSSPSLGHPYNVVYQPLLGCPRKLGSMVRINGLFHLLINSRYSLGWNNPLILPHHWSLTSCPGHPSIELMNQVLNWWTKYWIDDPSIELMNQVLNGCTSMALSIAFISAAPENRNSEIHKDSKDSGGLCPCPFKRTTWPNTQTLEPDKSSASKRDLFKGWWVKWVHVTLQSKGESYPSN